jgi:hypothetical protein
MRRCAELEETVATIIRTFDQEIVPWAETNLGRVEDVDRDGRFTILLTPWLGKLQDGKVAVDGFVRGSDFYRDLAAPFSNQCDMMYLNSRLRPGAHLRTLLAHEYTHAVMFSEHVLGDYLPGARRQDEEGWLNEGVAHLGERHLGRTWSNLDYRIRAYFAWPERFPLVVPDYYHAGLWRTPGTRGACYLFLDNCERSASASFLRRLTQSNLNGVANLEAATHEPFAAQFRRWSVAQLAEPKASPFHDAADTEVFIQKRIGPRFHDVSLTFGERTFEIAGTAVLYLRLHGPVAERTKIVIASEADMPFQVTQASRGRSTSRLQMTSKPTSDGEATMLTVTAIGGDVTLRAADWELLQSTAGAKGKATKPGHMSENLRAWFATDRIRAGTTLVSHPLRGVEYARASVAFKVLGEDAEGNALPAWAVRWHNDGSP